MRVFRVIGNLLDRFHNLYVPGAAAECAGQGIFDFLLSGIGVAVQQGLGGHDDARRAEPALNRPVFYEGFLYRVQVLCRASGGRLETAVEGTVTEPGRISSWPPPSLFHLPEEDPRIERMALSDLALSRNIFLLHRGDVTFEEKGGVIRLHARLPL